MVVIASERPDVLDEALDETIKIRRAKGLRE